MAVLPNLGASSFVTGERVGAGHSVRVAQRLRKYLPQNNALCAKMEAVIAGVTTSAGWYAYISDVMGLAYIGWLLSTGISMMRVKPKAVAPTLRERELKETG